METRDGILVHFSFLKTMFLFFKSFWSKVQLT